MVSLKDFLKIMEGSEVTLGTSCWDETLEIETTKMNIYVNGCTYFSVEEVYRNVKNPKVTRWAYTQPYSNDSFLEIWCKA